MKQHLPWLAIAAAISAAVFGFIFVAYNPNNPNVIVDYATGKGPKTTVTYYITKEAASSDKNKFGCGDILIPKYATVAKPKNTTDAIDAAVSALLSDKKETPGTKERNAVATSTLKIASVTGTTKVALTGKVVLGGECDNPRFIQQLQKTANVDGKTVEITINGKPLSSVGSLK